MALTRPILYTQVAFDARYEHVFNFDAVGGNQVVANKLTIIVQETGQTVYNQTQNTYTFSHTLPANTLTNGVYYSATVTTYDIQGNASIASIPIQFYCYTNPSLLFNNIPVSGIITNSSYTFSATYTQPENEPLSTYTINLLDAQRAVVATSGVKYVGSEAVPIDVEYTFNGFGNNTNYYVEAIGETINGTKVATTQINIIVQYVTPSAFAVVELNNNCSGGYVVIKSNMAIINGESVPDPPIYVDNDTAVDATAGGHYVDWNEGYQISGDFTMALWGHSFVINEPIVTLRSDDGNTFIVRYRIDDDSTHYIDLTIQNSDTILYYIYSPSIEVNTGDNLQFWVRRIGSIYQIELHNVATEGAGS